MKKLFDLVMGFFSGSTIRIALAVGLLAFGVIKYQGWKIGDLKTVVTTLKNTLTSEREHNEKVVGALEDKGESDHERQEFTQEAVAAVAAQPSKADPSPALRDAYRRVYERAAARKAENTR